MKRFAPGFKAGLIAELTGAEYIGDTELLLDSVSEPSHAEHSTLIFLEQEKYFSAVQASRAGVVITTSDFAAKLPGRNILVSDRPYYLFMLLVSKWLEMDSAAMNARSVSSEHARIAAGAVVSPEASIGAGCVIDAGCEIAANVRIGANCVLGKNVKVACDTIIYPNVTIYDDCEIGERVILHSGCVIGADGFGFLLIDGRQQKIPQIGNVVIHNDVEIGANTTIDRATLGSTIIGEGSKLDNLVQIGHNCVIGKHSIICALVGLAGSTVVGDYVYLAGQVGAAGHLSIGDRSMVGAQSGITADVPADSRYLGSPAMDAGAQKRIMVAQRYLPAILAAYKKGEKDKS